MKITQKQENFCKAYVETGNASEAYRRAYSVSPTTKLATINRKAAEVMRNGNVSARVAELRALSASKACITVDSLILELEEARQAALTAETPQASAAATATMGKAKLLGLDKQVVELSASIEHRKDITIRLVGG